jgi:hypothetical protein
MFINPNANNLSETQNDYAIFLPSISSIYAKIVSKKVYDVREKLPAGLPLGLKDLDFLNPNNNLFYYPYALYSAGHAYLDLKDTNELESMVQQRDRKNTLILGDSGGFQAATGVLKYPWFPKQNQSIEDNIRDKDDFRLKILRWLEFTADYSMLLDFPTYALVKYGLDPVTGISLHPSLKSFKDCLDGSIENHNFFIKHRKEGATKFLNVLQGRNMEEGDIWWNAVKDMPFESWSFSNVQASNFTVNLRRLIIMRDNGYLENRGLLHYLGNGKIPAGCALTTLQRTLRKYVDSKITISFDAASPFVMAAKGQQYFGYEISPNNIGFKGGHVPDEKWLKNNPELLNDWLKQNIPKKIKVIPSTIGNRLTIGDICVRGYEDLEYKKVAWTKKELETEIYKNSPEGKVGDLFKWNKEYKEYLTHSEDNGGLFTFSNNKFTKEYEKYQVKWPSSLDGLAYLFCMNHSVELHIKAVQEANRCQDLPTNEAKEYITQDLLEFKSLCPEIFTSERPMDLIMKNEKMLQKITGMDADNSVSFDIENC